MLRIWDKLGISDEGLRDQGKGFGTGIYRQVTGVCKDLDFKFILRSLVVGDLLFRGLGVRVQGLRV